MQDRVVTPRAALVDPSSFAPPPKNLNYYNPEATERQADRIPRKGPLSPAEYRAREEEKAKREKEEAAKAIEQRKLERQAKQQLRLEQQAHDGESGPPLPYRNDSTGLSTTQFAPPVARRDAPDGTIMIRPTASSKPSLPPRLPDRQNSSGAPSPSPTNERDFQGAQLSQRPSNRFGTTNSSVSSPTVFSQGQPQTENRGRPQPFTAITTKSPSYSSATSQDNPQLSELQTRFNRMATSSPKVEAPAQGKTWSERQAAIRTASSPRDKGFQQYEEVELPIEMRDNSASPIKKAPPPRPKKKAELSGNSVMASDSPPPIPLSSKPR